MALLQIPSLALAKGAANAPGGQFGELLESRLSPDYYTLLKAGRVYSSAIATINPTAFVGGAAGTPAIGIYNPVGSGADLVLIDVAVGIRTTGSAAVTIDFNHWLVNQGGVAVTGTATAPRNMYSGAQSGSVAVAMLNTANTAALASALVRPSVSVGLTAATAITNIGVLRDELKGLIIIAPGVYYAFGISATPTAASVDVAALWAEIPV